MKEKYGFVYIWRDNKKGKYYIGCRWGNENDGYICSSSWMKNTYKRRPDTFKRKILATNILCRKQLLLEEYRWLSMIKEKELGKRYYNLHNHHFNHWSSDINTLLTVGEKISKSQIGNKNHTTPHTDESKEKIKQSLKISKKQKEKFTPEVRQKLKEARARRTDEDFQKIKDALKLVPKQKCVYCGTYTDPGNFKQYHDEKCKHKILTSNWIT